jgi:hypothetical protein
MDPCWWVNRSRRFPFDEHYARHRAYQDHRQANQQFRLHKAFSSFIVPAKDGQIDDSGYHHQIQSGHPVIDDSK